MKLLAKPVGRGNWSVLTITIEGKWSGVFGHMWGFKVGQRFELGGITWRVVEVQS